VYKYSCRITNYDSNSVRLTTCVKMISHTHPPTHTPTHANTHPQQEGLFRL